MATAFDKLSYSYRTSIAKYFDLVVTIEIYIYWPNIVSFSAHTCAGIVHPNRVNRWPEPQLAALAALAKISAPFGSPIHAYRPAECPRMRRSRFLGDKRHYLTAPRPGSMRLAECFEGVKNIWEGQMTGG